MLLGAQPNRKAIFSRAQIVGFHKYLFRTSILKLICFGEVKKKNGHAMKARVSHDTEHGECLRAACFIAYTPEDLEI